MTTTNRDALRNALLIHEYKNSLLRSTRNGHVALDISKSSQLDSSHLDDEALSLIKQQTVKALSYFDYFANIPLKYGDVIDAFSRFLLWFFSIRVNSPTPGMNLQNLRYRNENVFSNYPHLAGVTTLPNFDQPSRTQRMGLLLFDILFPLIWNRLKDYAIDKGWANSEEHENKWYLLELIDKAFRISSLLNYITFLYDGRYRSMVERILQLRLVYQKAEGIRNVSFDFINQQLLFEGITDTLMVILPLLDWSYYRRRLGNFFNKIFKFFYDKLFSKLLARVFQSQLIPLFLKSNNDIIHVKVSSACVFCGSDPAVMPHIAYPCEHVYCYYCMKSNFFEEDEECVCVSCGVKVDSTQRV